MFRAPNNPVFALNRSFAGGSPHPAAEENFPLCIQAKKGCIELLAMPRKSNLIDGFVKLENAFPSEIAAEVRAILWRTFDCDPDARKT